MSEGNLPPRRSPEVLTRSSETPAAPAPLLYLTVDIGGGKQDAIVIYPEDKPAVLAQTFCSQKHLSASTCTKLEALIAQSKDSAFRFRATRSLDYRPPVPALGTRPSIGQDSVESRVLPSTSRYTRSISSERLSLRSDSQPRNYGEWLYQRDMTARHRKRVERQRSESEKRCWSVQGDRGRKKSRGGSESMEDELIHRGKETEKKIRWMRKHALEEEKLKCPFRPTLTPYHKHSSLSATESRFDKLFSDASLLSTRRAARTKAFLRIKCPFRPLTTVKKPVKETQLAMVDRLLNSKKEFDSAVSKLREELESSSVPSFHPATGRGPAASDSSRRGNVHDQLYEQRLQRAARLKELQQEYRATASQHIGALPQSQKMVGEYRRRQVERLFERVDSDGDGLVEVKQGEGFKGVDARTVRLLGAVWRDLENSGKKAALGEFKVMVENALKSLSPEEKSYVLRQAGAPASLTSPQSFLSSSSVRGSHRRPPVSSDIYSRSLSSRSQSADRLKKQKEDHEAQEMRECTFRPRLTTYHREQLRALF